MVNKYFNYPKKYLWDQKIWDGRMSIITPLFRWLQQKNAELFREKAGVEREGHYDTKTNSLVYADVADALEADGIRFHRYSMGGTRWLALIPVPHFGTKNYTSDIDTVIIPHDVDYSDKTWAMQTVETYREYISAAAKNNTALIFICTDKLDPNDMYISILQEAIVLFHLNYSRMYLDVSTVVKSGSKLADITEFTYKDTDGNIISDPDSFITTLADTIPALPVSGLWCNKDSLTFNLVTQDRASNALFNREAALNSIAAKRMAEGLEIEYLYDRVDDPAFINYWKDKGIRCEIHEFRGERYITMVPLCCFDAPGEKLPCVSIFQEVNAFDPHQAITAFSYLYQYTEICAQGDCILLWFVLENRDENDMLHDIVLEAAESYPIDLSRIYLTGHSHDGHFTLEYACRHPKELAAIAPLGNGPGLKPTGPTMPFFTFNDERMEEMHTFDIPTINICGTNEFGDLMPLYDAGNHRRSNQTEGSADLNANIKSWQSRLYAYNCPEKSFDEILATKDSPDLVERTIGIPADKTDVLYMDGSENYIADIKNNNGKYHLRIAVLGNMPHTVTPLMVDLSWSFMRRFKRDLETGEVIELY